MLAAARARRRGHRRVVAVRVLDGRDARAGGLRRPAADHARRLPHVHARRARRRRADLRRAGDCSARRSAPAEPAPRLVAAAIAVAAAVGEARGLRIVPQVRRQVPESWRRVLPVPLAAGLYGVLLGLGFTTFILTFAVWALAAVSVALGDPALGAVLGLAFGAGRALPVIALAPIADSDRGNAAHAAMAERPAILRGLRAADAVALAALRRRDRRRARAGGGAERGRRGACRARSCRGHHRRRRGVRPGRRRAPVRLPAPGRHRLPAPRRRHVRAPRPRSRARRRPRRLARRGADRARATRTRSRPSPTYDVARRRRLRVQRPVGRVAGGHRAARRPAAQRSRPRRASSRPRARSEQLGRPALAGQSLVFHRAGRVRLPDPAARPRHGPERGCAPSAARCCSTRPSTARELLYVRSTYTRQELRLGPPGRRATDARPPPLRHHPDRPPRRRARAGPRPPPRGLPGAQAAPARAAPARRGHRHAVDHGARAARRRT